MSFCRKTRSAPLTACHAQANAAALSRAPSSTISPRPARSPCRNGLSRRPSAIATLTWRSPTTGSLWINNNGNDSKTGAAVDPAIGHGIEPRAHRRNDTSNQYGAVTMVAPITSTVRLPLSPLHVLLPADPSTGLPVPSVAVFGQIHAVDRIRLIKKLGEVDALVMLQVDQAIRAAVGLP